MCPSGLSVLMYIIKSRTELSNVYGLDIYVSVSYLGKYHKNMLTSSMLNCSVSLITP